MVSSTTAPGRDSTSSSDGEDEWDFALVIAWAGDARHRIGESAFLPRNQAVTLGRGDDDVDPPRIRWCRQRPDMLQERPELKGAGISRKQLILIARDDHVVVDVVGKCSTRVNGERTTATLAVEGNTIWLSDELLVQVVRRPRSMPAAVHLPKEFWGPFGAANAFGLVGESPAFWEMLEEIAIAAKTGKPVLILGGSGTGKEGAASAVHKLSGRPSGMFVAVSAPTITPSLFSSLVFGNVRNYPNVGQPETPGYIGMANGGTLFLDEIGEMDAAEQAKLLRVVEEQKIWRLGDSKPTPVDFRLVCGTNRPEASLKADFGRRFSSVVVLPSLDERREDIPLIARHVINEAAERGDPRVADLSNLPHILDRLLRRSWPGNVRELERVLLDALKNPKTLLGASQSSPAPPVARPSAPPKDGITPEKVRALLHETNDNVSEVARLLGKTRSWLRNFMKVHGIKPRRRNGSDHE